jgi:hypothetical protein
MVTLSHAKLVQQFSNVLILGDGICTLDFQSLQCPSGSEDVPNLSSQSLYSTLSLWMQYIFHCSLLSTYHLHTLQDIQQFFQLS